MMPWSIISMAAGTTPRAMMSETVAAHSPTSTKSSNIVRTEGGTGVSRTQTRATIPSVPSEPTTTPRRS